LGSLSSSPFSGLSSDCKFTFDVQNIPAHILEGVWGVSIISFSRVVSSVGDSAFANTYATITVNSMISAASIGNNAFKNASGVSYLLDLNSPSIGTMAFSGCKNITNLSLGARVSSIGQDAFSGCTGIKKVELRCTSLTKASHAFRGVGDELTVMEVGTGMTMLPDEVFIGFGGKVTLPATVKNIGTSALEGCSLTNSDLSYLTSLEYVSDRAFSRSNVSAIYIGQSLAGLSPTAFNDCNGVEKITVARSDMAVIVNNGTSKFSGISNTGAELILGSNVYHIGDNVFNGATVISSVDLSNITSIGKASFKGTTITELTLPEGLTKIGSESFADIPELRDIDFLNANLDIGKDSFFVTASHFDTWISCYRHSTAASYNWAGDHRDIHPTYYHVEGEYDGMLEVLYLLGEKTIGDSATNMIIDFFIDNVSLTVLESIDMGSVESNTLLLIAIAILLLVLLFVFIYTDFGERVRIIEIIIATIFTFVVAECAIRRILDYPDWYWFVSIWVACGFVPIILGAYRSIHEGRRAPSNPDQTLHLLYSNQLREAVYVGLRPMMTFTDSMKPVLRIIYFVLCLPLGIVECAIYLAVFFLSHLPAVLFSAILCRIFGNRENKNEKHRDFTICPACGVRIDLKHDCMHYRCSCGTEHKDLRAGKYGIHLATCAKCSERLPCGYRRSARASERWNGPVTGMCPTCGADIKNYECDPYSIAVVGSAGSGKTTLIAAASEGISGIGAVSLVSRESSTDKLIREYGSGSISPTRDATRPHVTYFKTVGRDVRGLYLFDSVGGVFSKAAHNVVSHYALDEGIILTINPDDLGNLAEKKDPSIIVTNFVNDFQLTAANASIPLAVVVTMADRVQYGGSPLIGASEEDIRNYLASKGQINTLDNLEQYFSNVGFFAIGSSDQEDAAVSVVKWIVNQSGGITLRGEGYHGII